VVNHWQFKSLELKLAVSATSLTWYAEHTHTHVYMHLYQLQPRVISNGANRVSNACLKCIRLMALFASWKERTLDQSTLETQVCLCLHRKAWTRHYIMYIFLAIYLVVLSVHFQGNLPWPSLLRQWRRLVSNVAPPPFLSQNIQRALHSSTTSVLKQYGRSFVIDKR